MSFSYVAPQNENLKILILIFIILLFYKIMRMIFTNIIFTHMIFTKIFSFAKRIINHVNFNEPEINWNPPLTKPEQILYHRLTKTLPDHIILSQVSFGRFLYVNSGNKKKDFALEATFRQKVVDFLVCDNAFNIIAAIELDDRSHDKLKDEKRDKIFERAGIRVIRWNVKAMPSESKIINELLP
ncbi:MAG: DUF2726 domain-containing protein [Magnetococcales bacterium]|nr:DUF2726 domain-containing protein [Magnetococcales bacterium]